MLTKLKLLTNLKLPMGIFTNRRPRGYHHVMIYSNGRKERLKAMEERARRELGMQPAEEPHRDRLRGAFTDCDRHQNHIRERGGRRSYAVLIVLIAAMLMLMYYLLTGYWFI